MRYSKDVNGTTIVPYLVLHSVKMRDLMSFARWTKPTIDRGDWCTCAPCMLQPCRGPLAVAPADSSGGHQGARAARRDLGRLGEYHKGTMSSAGMQ